jgi:membrane protein
MEGMAKPGWLSWKGLAKQIWTKVGDDDVFGRSAQLAYYFLLALFPLLIFVTALLGLFPGAAERGMMVLFEYLGEALPKQASDLVQTGFSQVMQASGGGKISFGIMATLWAASAGMTAIMDALNAAYEAKESRSLIKQYATAIALTVVVALLLVVAVAVVFFGDKIADAVFPGGVIAVVWKIVQWPVALIFVLLAFSLIYFYGPDSKKVQWHWITPGAVAGLLLWLAASFALRIYLHLFNTYNATYGSLGGVMILLLWFYLTGAAILIGAEINSVIENAAAEDGTAVEAKLPIPPS